MTISSITYTDITTGTTAVVAHINTPGNDLTNKVNEIIVDVNANSGDIADLTVARTAAKRNLALANGTDSDHDVDVTADVLSLQDASTSSWDTVLSSVSVTPAIDASGANGLDTGSVANNTWCSVWVIYNGVTTAGLFSLHATAPTMPSGYTKKRRVGWVLTDGSANILAFENYAGNDWFLWVAAQSEDTAALNSVGVGTFAAALTKVPSGTRIAKLQMIIADLQHSADNGDSIIWFAGASGGVTYFAQATIGKAATNHYAAGWVETSLTSSQSVNVSSVATANATWSGTFSVKTLGWYDNA